MINKNFCKFCLQFTILSIITLIIFYFVCKWDIENHFIEELEKTNQLRITHISYADKIKYFGFHFEEHKILTEDGYFLTAWRICGKSYESQEEIAKKYKRSVLLVHGLLDNSYTYLAMSDRESLPFILANNGYDVWLINNRGTLFSRDHIHHNSYDSSSDYWDFTFHELAQYDVKATIQYIKQTAKREKISYVCHSQGCFQFLISYTMDPEFIRNSVDKYGTMGNVLQITNIVLNFITFRKRNSQRISILSRYSNGLSTLVLEM
jgi:hypothetical protein